MAGEVLADDNSPMMMTVAQYNDRVAYTWKLATEAEQERIIELLEDSRERTNQRIQSEQLTGVDLAERIGVYKTLGNAIALIKGEK